MRLDGKSRSRSRRLACFSSLSRPGRFCFFFFVRLSRLLRLVSPFAFASAQESRQAKTTRPTLFSFFLYLHDLVSFFFALACTKPDSCLWRQLCVSSRFELHGEKKKVVWFNESIKRKEMQVVSLLSPWAPTFLCRTKTWVLWTQGKKTSTTRPRRQKVGESCRVENDRLGPRWFRLCGLPFLSSVFLSMSDRCVSRYSFCSLAVFFLAPLQAYGAIYIEQTWKGREPIVCPHFFFSSFHVLPLFDF